MKRSEAVNKLNDWFKLVEAKKLPEWASTSGDYLMWYLETHTGMLPPWSNNMKLCYCNMRSSCPGCAPSIYTPKWEKE